MAEGERVSVMSTDHGRIVLTTPELLTAEDLADFDAWIAIVRRTLGRRALARSPDDGGTDAER